MDSAQQLPHGIVRATFDQYFRNHDFPPNQPLAGLADPVVVMKETRNEYLMPYERLISPTPTRYVLVVGTAGGKLGVLRCIKDTARGDPFGKKKYENVSGARRGREAGAETGGNDDQNQTQQQKQDRTFDIEFVEFVEPNPARDPLHTPLIAHLPNAEDAEAFLAALPHTFTASAFAKENKGKVSASNWNSFALTVKHPGNTGIRLHEEPRVACTTYPNRRLAVPTQKLPIARPSTLKTWLTEETPRL